MFLNKKVIDEIGTLLHAKNEQIAVAESVTAGSLQLYLSQIELASQVFCGGLTLYDANHKRKVLRININPSDEEHCVSSSITQQMSVHLHELYDIDWSIASTGFATPVPNHQQLFAFYAFSYKGKLVKDGRIDLNKPLKPLEAQFTFASEILQLFLKTLQNRTFN